MEILGVIVAQIFLITWATHIRKGIFLGLRKLAHEQLGSAREDFP
jgi:hypothetical protein